mmetsp:Transcript_10202/g.30823  ORF Transcript_10202/g.30823 Transcript_10202/m.30823 type:complete len:231 (+) Transcript_10202:2098-2790(+)
MNKRTSGFILKKRKPVAAYRCVTSWSAIRVRCTRRWSTPWRYAARRLASFEHKLASALAQSCWISTFSLMCDSAHRTGIAPVKARWFWISTSSLKFASNPAIWHCRSPLACAALRMTICNAPCSTSASLSSLIIEWYRNVAVASTCKLISRLVSERRTKVSRESLSARGSRSVGFAARSRNAVTACRRVGTSALSRISSCARSASIPPASTIAKWDRVFGVSFLRLKVAL